MLLYWPYNYSCIGTCIYWQLSAKLPLHAFSRCAHAIDSCAFFNGVHVTRINKVSSESDAPQQSNAFSISIETFLSSWNVKD